MTSAEIITRLKTQNRSEVARATKIRRGYLDDLVYGRIKNPGSKQIETLRSYLLSLEFTQGRHQ